MLARVLGICGRVLVASGLLVLLFVAYQLWGTGLLEAHSQAGLRAELSKELPRGTNLRDRPSAAPIRRAEGSRRSGAASKHSSGSRQSPGASLSVAPATATPAASPATGQPVGVIDIPSIGLDQVIVEGVQAAQLATGPGHYPGTPLPGEAGNVAIAGHRTTYAHPFYDLNAVPPGADIDITTPQGVFVYAAGGQSVVAPTDVSVIGPTPGDRLTLTTCNPRYSASTRLVLHATLVASRLYPGAPHSAGRSPAAGVQRSTTAPRGAGGTDRGGGRTGGGGIGGGTGGGIGGGIGGGTGGGIGGGAHDWPAAVLWGAAVVVAAAGVILLGRRVAPRGGRHAGRRWAVYLPGVVAVLAVLFFFFAALNPLLPASL